MFVIGSFGPADSSASCAPVLPGLPALCREDLARRGGGCASERATLKSCAFSCWQEEHVWLNLKRSRFKGSVSGGIWEHFEGAHSEGSTARFAPGYIMESEYSSPLR